MSINEIAQTLRSVSIVRLGGRTDEAAGSMPRMKFRRYKFRILLSLLCIVATAMPVVDLILTIGEGRNPFGFLFPLSMPGFYLLDTLDRFLPVPEVGGLFIMLLGLPVNLLLYFLLGYLMDYIVNRLWSRE